MHHITPGGILRPFFLHWFSCLPFSFFALTSSLCATVDWLFSHYRLSSSILLQWFFMVSCLIYSCSFHNFLGMLIHSFCICIPKLFGHQFDIVICSDVCINFVLNFHLSSFPYSSFIHCISVFYLKKTCSQGRNVVNCNEIYRRGYSLRHIFDNHS